MKLIMTLLSDALPGSGEGLGGIIDVDVNYDEYGLPYIPAKRLKGILRESALDLRDVEKLTDPQVETLFGTRGKKHGTSFRLSDGYLPNYQQIRAFLKECAKERKDDKTYKSSFHRQAVLDFYTYTRAQTAIEDSGVAKEHSLRTFRVLKKDLTFAFECEDLSKDDLENLKLICAVTRRFGSSRTRGLGAIALRCDCSAAPTNTTLQDDNNEEHPKFREDETCICRLDIQTHGQILVTNEIGSDQVSEAYLPGSFLLGALAEAYIRGKKLEDAHQDECFRAIFLNGGVRFGNAYPVAQGKAYFPAPLSIVKEKDSQRYIDLVRSETDKQTKGGFDKFIRFDSSKEAQTCSPDKEIEYHHARPEEKRWLGHANEGDGQFFQFEVLSPHQQFRAEIIGTYAHLRVIQELIATTPTVFLGKSKTAQYGKCSMVGTLEKIDSSKNTITWPDGGKLVVTLASDMMLCNEHGLMIPDPKCFKEELFERLKMNAPTLTAKQIEFEKNKRFLKTKQIGGFVGVWNMPKIQGTALAAGSVIVLRNTSGQNLDVTELQQAAFGLRTEEGFGRIKLNWHGDFEIHVAKKEVDDEPVFDDDLTAATPLISHIVTQRIQSALKTEAVKKSEDIHKKITNAFLGRLRLFLMTSNTFQAFQEKCSALKQRGREHLMKLDRVLFLDGQDKITVDLKRFDDVVNGLKQVQTIRAWQYSVLQSAGINLEALLKEQVKREEDDQQKQPRFTWYKLYALHLITLLKLKNRKKEDSPREK